MAAPVLLTYNLDSQRKLKLRFVCAELKLILRSVPESDYAQPLAALAGLCPRTEAAYSGEGFPDEMLVMANFNNHQFHALLDALRRSGMPPIPLKAVLTPTNAEWDSVKLHAEILREHETMHGKGR